MTPSLDELRAVARIDPYWVAEYNGVLLYLDEGALLEMDARRPDGSRDASRRVQAAAWGFLGDDGVRRLCVHPSRWADVVGEVRKMGGELRYRKLVRA